MKDLLSYKANLLTKFISPTETAEEDYARIWQKMTKYKRKPVSGKLPYFTTKKEHVRSNSEVQIANRLKTKNIPYHYEKPLYLDNQKVFHPDFTVLNKFTKQVIIWEHFRIESNENIGKSILKQLEQYSDYGFTIGKNLIVTFETPYSPLTTESIDELIDTFF